METNPWSFLHSFGAPNVDWCEASVAGAWITEPANTWSNLAYIAVALMLWRPSRRSSDPLLRRFAPYTFLLGIFSGLYHASSTFALQVFDFLAMFLVFMIPLFINLRRLGVEARWVGPGAHTAFALAATATVPLVASWGFPIQALIGILAATILGTEAILRGQAQTRASYRPYLWCLGLLGFAGAASAADVTRVFCDPTNPVLQGHAVWHVLAAAATYYCFRFYESLPNSHS